MTRFMKTYFLRLLAPLACGVLSFLPAAGRGADQPYRFLKAIPVGGEGGWDYLTVDADGRRLYVSHGSNVAVIDLTTDAVAGQITNTPGVHGIAVASALHRAFVSNGRGGDASVVDAATLQTLSRVKTENNPDCILFEPGRSEVYAFNGRSGSATVFSADSGKVVSTVALDGKPEFAQADPEVGRVFDNLEDKNVVAVIDTQTHTVVRRWPIAPGEGASGMAIDPAHHHLFLGCDNQMMVMMDSISGKVLASVPIGRGVDANAFDPGTQLAFASCGRDGTTTIAHEKGETLTVVQTLKTENGARTMALDPVTHRIYLATAQFEPSSGQPAGEERRRPRPIPGSFKILVYGME
jgi:DNA-binding beta-propeller fold protein YncE